MSCPTTETTCPISISSNVLFSTSKQLKIRSDLADDGLTASTLFFSACRNGMRAVAIPFRSTAENLARHFFSELKARIPGLCRVKVWETPDSCAEYAE